MPVQSIVNTTLKGMYQYVKSGAIGACVLEFITLMGRHHPY